MVKFFHIVYSKNPGDISARIIAILFDKILANLNILPKIIAEKKTISCQESCFSLQLKYC